MIVSPGKSGGNPVEGAVPVLPGVVPTFPSSTDYVCLFWNAAGMPNDVPNGIIWTLDGTCRRFARRHHVHLERRFDGATELVRPVEAGSASMMAVIESSTSSPAERMFVAEFVIGD